MIFDSIRICTNDLIGENQCVEGVDALIMFSMFIGFVGLMIGLESLGDYIKKLNTQRKQEGRV